MIRVKIAQSHPKSVNNVMSHNVGQDNNDGDGTVVIMSINVTILLTE